MSAKSDEVLVLEAALKAVTDQFDEFVGACTGPDGKPIAPATKALMRAKACLPSRCPHAFNAKP
ncbi:hypothetical protein WJ96_06790 [Burkholderia ubonensis]|uniref:Uncharacterized protein n=1 Tax=Burkholderia ubonensis TaxID=101571 RepID=A0AAW3MRK8_9BURK|nr:hypothetical protein [Burkholderia ubonensis]KVP98224.1 hypothetical protein WJ96_06790 [Burkholderia ubonensis]KVZ92921.1 hypothetical protein WL25_18450 [Burkholderia ubonensis]